MVGFHMTFFWKVFNVIYPLSLPLPPFPHFNLSLLVLPFHFNPLYTIFSLLFLDTPPASFVISWPLWVLWSAHIWRSKANVPKERIYVVVVYPGLSYSLRSTRFQLQSFTCKFHSFIVLSHWVIFSCVNALKMHWWTARLFSFPGYY